MRGSSRRDAPVLAGPPGSGGQGEVGTSVGVPAALGPFQVRLGATALSPAASEMVLTAAPVAAGGAQDSHSGGVAAAFGGEMAAVAEHVGPAAERLEVVMGMGAELEAGGDGHP
jgi:hypothetical protein